MAKKTTPAIDLLLPSAVIIKDNLPTFFLLLVVPLLLSGITGPAPELSDTPTFSELIQAMRSMITPYALLGSVLTFIFFPLLTYAQWQAAKRKTIDLSQAVRGGMKYYWRLLGLLMLISAIIGIGLTAFILPGIIFLRMFILSPFYLIHSNLSILDSIRKSARESRDHKWSIYGVLGVIVLFNIMSSFGVVGQICGTILTVLYSLALALRFYEINKK